jgi:hypothetical protein
MVPRRRSEQLWHWNWFRLWLALATPNHIRDRQAFRGIISAEKHGDEAGHRTRVVFTNRPPAKRADSPRIIFTEPTFHSYAPG